ncbi:MAG: hypothetical protein C4567_05950 [Deltaproteobacteria bacterium]|nr:MAG: hypothetical protein C4567_05950 [Deltaproteobacteria bacterium]
MNLLEAWLREDDSGAAYFRAIQPAIPANLVSAVNYARILEVASRVPGVCALGGFYFEFFLGEEEARADISFRAAADQGCPEALAAWEPAGRGVWDGSWPALKRLAGRWKQPGGLLQEEIEAIWLEFDINGTRPYSPSFFLTPAPPRRSWAGNFQGCKSLLEFLSGELNGAISPTGIAAALSCLERLPGKARLGQIGFMLSRRPAVLRLCLEMEGKEIPKYLRSLGEFADLRQVAEILEMLSPYDHEFILHLDLLEELQPKVGLDLMLSSADSFPDPRLEIILNELCHLKLCTPAKGEALQNISGCTPMGADLINWPPGLRRRSLQSGLDELSYFIRSISHLKMVIEPGKDPVAKGYVGVNHYWKKNSVPAINPQ